MNLYFSFNVGGKNVARGALISVFVRIWLNNLHFIFLNSVLAVSLEIDFNNS
jgi:hypothetical protein